MMNTPLLLAQADKSSGSGVLLLTPFSKLVGTLAEPLMKSAKASSGLTVVPAGAPLLFRNPGMPLPSQRTTSVAWHAAANKSRSAWQAAGQEAGPLMPPA